MKETVEIETTIDDGASVPVYASDWASGADVRAHIDAPVRLNSGEISLIPTGVRVAIPNGYEIQVRPRSGLALRNAITVLNSPGTIDSDYRGEIQIIIINHGKEAFTVLPGMRIAQLVVTPVRFAYFVVQQKLSTTVRDSGGFGHSGIL